MLTILLIAFSLSIDSFALSVTDGFNIKKNRLLWAIKIAFLFGLFQAIMPIIGWLIGIGLEKIVESFDHWISFAILSSIGIKMIRDKKIQRKIISDVTFLTGVLQSFATSIDALALGVSFAFFKVSILTSALVIGFTTFVMCIIGVLLGNKIGSKLSGKVETFGGIILILIGLKILLSHLLNINLP